MKVQNAMRQGQISRLKSLIYTNINTLYSSFLFYI